MAPPNRDDQGNLLPTDQRVGRLEERSDDLERRLGVTEGNVNIVARQGHRLVSLFYALLERIRRIERALGLRPPPTPPPAPADLPAPNTETLAPEDAAAADDPEEGSR